MGEMGIRYLCFYLPALDMLSSWHSVVVIVAALLSNGGIQSSFTIIFIATMVC